VHCDVRPANVVVVAGRALLIDWGLAQRAGAPAPPRCVVAFADRYLLGAEDAPAAPRVDALAALFTWCAVAFGGDACAAPWLALRGFGACDDGVLSARGQWLRDASGGALGARAQRVAHAVAAIEKGGRAADAVAAAREAVAAAD